MKYKVLREVIVFAIGKKEYSCKSGDIIELPEEHITTRALIERKSIAPVEVEIEVEDEQPKPEKTKKTTKK